MRLPHTERDLSPSDDRPAGRRAGRRGVPTISTAGALSALAVLLTGAAALVVVQDRRVAATTTEPAATIQVVRGAENETTVTAQLSFPGLKVGGVLDVTRTSVGTGSRYQLARSVVRVSEDGPAVAQLVASVSNEDDDVVIEARAPGRRCPPTVGRCIGYATGTTRRAG